MPGSGQGLVLRLGHDRATVTICSTGIGITRKSHRREPGSAGGDTCLRRCCRPAAKLHPTGSQAVLATAPRGTALPALALTPPKRASRCR